MKKKTRKRLYRIAKKGNLLLLGASLCLNTVLLTQACAPKKYTYDMAQVDYTQFVLYCEKYPESDYCKTFTNPVPKQYRKN